MPEGKPVLAWENVPVPEPSDTLLPVGEDEVPQTVPRSVTVAPPSLDTVPPNTAVVSVTDANVGVSTVGGTTTPGSVVKEDSAEVPVPTRFVAQARK